MTPIPSSSHSVEFVELLTSKIANSIRFEEGLFFFIPTMGMGWCEPCDRHGKMQKMKRTVRIKDLGFGSPWVVRRKSMTRMSRLDQNRY